MSDSLFARSAATEALILLLGECPEGEVVTWEAMARATNRDIQRRDRHLLDRARKVLLKERRISFGTIVRVGVQRHVPSDLAKEGGRTIKRIGRAARRGGRLMDAAEVERLNPQERMSHVATRGVLAAVEASAQRPDVPRPEKVRNASPKVTI